MEIRPYDPTRDADDLWELKRAFELGLGAGTGGDEKRTAYEGKVTDAYRRRYLEWVDRCTDSDERCLTVAVDEESQRSDRSDDDGPRAGGAVVGYVFVLPEDLALIWDAAILNEIYVRESHRGTGVADELMAAAVELARDQDLPLDRLVLDVDRENDRAGAFYERHGFEHWGEMVARPL